MVRQEAGLPLWLRPYEVLVTSNRTSLIELVPNTLSIHAIKAKSPANTSLRAHFIARYGLVSPLPLTMAIVLRVMRPRGRSSMVCMPSVLWLHRVFSRSISHRASSSTVAQL